MNRLRVLLFATIIASFSWQAEGQKLESDGFTLRIMEYAEGETAVVCGPKKPAYGCLVQVRAKNKLKGRYSLSMLYMSETQYILTVKDKNKSLVNPMLVYDKAKAVFQYSSNDVLFDEATVDVTKPMAEQMLEGMLLWLKVKKKLNEKK